MVDKDKGHDHPNETEDDLLARFNRLRAGTSSPQATRDTEAALRERFERLRGGSTSVSSQPAPLDPTEMLLSQVKDTLEMERRARQHDQQFVKAVATKTVAATEAKWMALTTDGKLNVKDADRYDQFLSARIQDATKQLRLQKSPKEQTRLGQEIAGYKEEQKILRAALALQVKPASAQAKERLETWSREQKALEALQLPSTPLPPRGPRMK